MERFSPTRLRSARLACGQRPEHLALAVERSVDSIRGYEAGRIDPPASVIAKLASALNCRVGELFEIEVD